ncbi:centriole duplication and spindle assembly protein centrobin [Colletes latitarsis]|uniref:centriole duplication and spindle assembly protein centrobin n=1 Tax=Colletes latitarsis TaxID=2605962 RepID=UPI0040359974
MMSDSDDTDVLLLIPPDLFLVPSSDSDANSDRGKADYSSGKTGVISELVEHMQSLENRITAIEFKDTSLDGTLLNNSLESQIHNNPIIKFRQTLPRTNLYVSQSCSLQNTPVKPRKSLSVPTTPNSYSLSNHTNFNQNDMKLGNCLPMATGTNTTNVNDHDKDKHDHLISHSESSVVLPFGSRSVGFSHATATSSKGELCSYPLKHCKTTSNMFVKPSTNQLHSMPSTSTLFSVTEQPHSCSKVSIQNMELSEVNELLQEMEATELELSKRINSVSKHQCHREQSDMLISNHSNNASTSKINNDTRKNSINRKLEFDLEDSNEYCDIRPIVSKNMCSNVFPDISLPYNSSFNFDESEKIISEFKSWGQNGQKPTLKTEKVENISELKNANNIDKLIVNGNNIKRRESVIEQIPLCADDVNSVNATAGYNVQPHSAHKNVESSLLSDLAQYTSSQQNNNVQQMKQMHNGMCNKSIAHASTNTDCFPRKSQRLLSLSDFWDNNSNKSQEEMRRIKLEEEKFRREHCEHLIQELQKRLLEQQEKVAVALRVDNEKNELIVQFNNAWSKLKQRVHILENEYSALQTNMRNTTEKHQLEISELQSQIKRCEGELSKALDLAAGYKEKSDSVIKEKVELLKNHADELENYKSFVLEAETKCEQIKVDSNKILEEKRQIEETLKSLQQELGKERLKGGEVRNEMNVIHKALDTCEAELTVLRQEKENLQLKLKEEINRNAILQQKHATLLLSVDDAKKAEKVAKDETKSLVEEKEKIRSELQEVYQKQVDEVVKVKLREFQAQLDVAESEFLEELKTRQQVIAECAARKIKDIIDKHRLEINLLEEKQKEEKRLCELQLAQALQKSSILETELHSQRATKSQLAEQLHSVMQKQWLQALQIISGGNMEDLTPLQKIHAERLFKAPKKSESMPNCFAKVFQEPRKLTLQPSDIKNFHDQGESMSTITPIDDTPLTSRKELKDDLRKYVKMIAEMQQSRDEHLKIRENISSPPLICREVPRKHYLKKELSIKDEDSVMTWQPAPSETTPDTSEFIPASQICTKGDQLKHKPPWK